MAPRQVSALFHRALVTGALILATALPVLSHEVAMLPARAPAKDKVLPVLLPGGHLAISPAALDFGEVVVGQSATLSVELTNVSTDDLTITASAEAPFGVQQAPIVLPAGAPPLILTVTVTPVAAGDLSGVLTLASEHAGVLTPDEQVLSLSANPRTPPNLVFSVPEEGLLDVEGYDFGLVSLRAYLVAEAPSFRVTVRNEGTPGITQTARDVRFEVGGPGANLAGLGSCNQGIVASDVCVAFDDDQPVDGTEFDLAPGEEIGLRFRLLPLDTDWLDQTFPLTVANAPDRAFTVTGGVISYTFESGPFVRLDGGQEMPSPPEVGVSTDPLGPNPALTFAPTGFDPKTVFSLGEVDAVDARSGNAVLTIPLGGPQPARGALAYELQAVINTRIWKRWPMTTLDVPPGGGGGQAEGVGAPDPDQRFESLNAEYPNPLDNVTAGVSIHLGRLIPPTSSTGAFHPVFPPNGVDPLLEFEHVVQTGPRFVYIDPSGAEHEFYLELHGDEPQGPANQMLGATELYTRDGSFLRLVFDPSVSNRRWVESGDGLRRLFVRQTSAQPTLPDEWLLKEIHDRSGNKVTIDYAPARWTIRDNGDADGFRETRVLFEEPGFPTLVSRVQLRGFGGGTREYKLQYSAPRTVPRPETSSFHDHLAAHHPTLDVDVRVKTLDRVILPDPRATFELFWGVHDLWNPLVLDSYRMPTGAEVHYEHGRNWNNVPNCVSGRPLDLTAGVTRRKVKDIGGGVIADQRFFREARRVPELVDAHPCPNHPTAPAPHAEQRVAVWTDHEKSGASFDGLSSVELHYYSIYPLPWSTGDPTGFGYVERNLAISKAEDDGGGRYISKRRYSCDFDLDSGPVVGSHASPAGDDEPGDRVGDDIDDLVASADCTLRESTFAKYEVEQSGYCRFNLLQWCLRDSRLRDEKTYYGDDGDKWVRIIHSGYDGLGHYRATEIRSNFQTANAVLQRRYQGFNPGVAPLNLNAEHQVVGGWQLPANFDDWLLELWDEQWVEDGSGRRMGGEARFTAAGQIELERTWENGSRGSHDLVVRHYYNDDGERIHQRFFGADTYPGGSVPAGASWDTLGNWTEAQEDYSVLFLYDKGVLTHKKVANQNVWEINSTIDEGTGWKRQDLLNSGETVTYGYDGMGRITSIERHRSANEVFTYHENAQGRWSLSAKTYPQGVLSGTPLRTYDATYDGLGRIVTEEIPGFDGGPVQRSTAYHPSGQVDSFTSLDHAQRQTRFEWDISGRLRKRRDPNNGGAGSQAGLTVVNYTGARREKIRQWVHTASDPAALPAIGETLAETVVERDGLGRVVKITLPEGAVTTYAYDPLGKLTRAARGVQERVWGTDGRGFVTSESIPERQVTAAFSDFDTRGQARRLQEGGRVTVSAFDELGRPTCVEVGGQTIKSFSYHPRRPGQGAATASRTPQLS